MQRRLLALVAALVTGYSFNATAQTTAGAGTVIMLPLVADIPAAYTTTVFVQNTHSTPITIDIAYYFSIQAGNPNSDPNLPGTGLPASAPCTQLTIPGNAVATFDPYTQCNLASVAGSITNIFGTMLLVDATATVKSNTFYAYSRTAQPVGALGPNNGFSVEGFPVGNFTGGTTESASAIGLQASTAAPHYRSNCFVAALNEQVDWQLRLFDASGTPLGAPNNPLSGTLLPYQSTRILNVFAAVYGTPYTTNYDFSNIRATFSNSDNSAMIAYCTVETQDNGSADFRIAKSDDANDVRQSRQACYGMDSCGSGTSSTTNPAYLNSTTKKNIHYAILDQPDYVQCTLVSDSKQHLDDLEIMLRVPGDPQTATQFNVSAQPAPYKNTSIYSSGGPAQTSFYIYTGEKSTIASGATTRWYIDVSGNQSSLTLPTDVAANGGKGIPYGITCTAGNGMTVPWLGTTISPANP
jgi:hypothetical protein